MNREILFRGKRLDTGEWVEGDLITNPLGQAWIKPKSNAPHFKNGRYSKGFTALIAFKEVYPKTIGQWTGLYDHTGRGIFEGDAINAFGGEYWYGTWEHTKLNHEIKDIHDEFVFMQILGSGYEKVEVIGTIHD